MTDTSLFIADYILTLRTDTHTGLHEHEAPFAYATDILMDLWKQQDYMGAINNAVTLDFMENKHTHTHTSHKSMKAHTYGTGPTATQNRKKWKDTVELLTVKI